MAATVPQPSPPPAPGGDARHPATSADPLWTFVTRPGDGLRELSDPPDRMARIGIELRDQPVAAGESTRRQCESREWLAEKGRKRT
ncbi:hypothetical protein GCM10027360_44410 [Amycolatopsis echigonensis]